MVVHVCSKWVQAFVVLHQAPHFHNQLDPPYKQLLPAVQKCQQEMWLPSWWVSQLNAISL